MIIGLYSGLIMELLVWAIVLLGSINSLILIKVMWGMSWKLNIFKNGAFKFRIGLILAHLFGILIEIVWVIGSYCIFLMLKFFLFNEIYRVKLGDFAGSFLMIWNIGYIIVVILHIVFFIFLVFWYRLYNKYW